MTAPSMALDPPVVFESGEPIGLHNITVPDRLRALREGTVADLVASFAEIGLVNSITVRPKKSGFALVAGRHRLEAAKRCGWKSIRCTIVDGADADKAELIEIDENLVRAALSPAERAAHVARRKALYEKIHPQTTTGKAPGKAGGGKKAKNAKLASFVEATAKATGQSKRKVARDATRGKRVAVLSEIVGTSLDKGAELDAIAKLSEPEQRELAERAMAGEEVTARPAAMPEVKPTVAAVPAKTTRSILIHIADLARDCRGLLAHPAQNTAVIREKLSQIIKLSDPDPGAAKTNTNLDQKLFRRAMALEGGNEAPARCSGNDVDTQQSADERRKVNEALASDDDLSIPACLRRKNGAVT